MKNLNKIFAALPVLLFPAAALAGERGEGIIRLDGHPAALFCLAVFVISYIAVLFEERTHMRKSKPVMLGAGIIWIVIALLAPGYGIDHQTLRAAVFHGLEEYGSLLLFLLAAMTYISALQERRVFDVLRARLVRAGLSLRQIFWVTGLLAFCLSPVADNLTTALVMGAVVMAVGGGEPRFILLACINVVSAANAGGAFSPFGDITTLMVWQAGHLGFFDFFALFLPSVVCFLVPAAIMTPFVPAGRPRSMTDDVNLKKGARFIIFLGLSTIAMAVGFEQILGLPPFMGMMMGLSLLLMMGWFIRKVWHEEFDAIDLIAASEWDTLLFFFGVIFSVGGLAFIGYLELTSDFMYGGWGASSANIAMGVASALIDNIPIMFAVLSMNPELDRFQWLLVTLTTGVGGSLLSIGSAAGVALMGIARGQYTFFGHLKWAPALMLGYAAAIGVHFLLNS